MKVVFCHIGSGVDTDPAIENVMHIVDSEIQWDVPSSQYLKLDFLEMNNVFEHLASVEYQQLVILPYLRIKDPILIKPNIDDVLTKTLFIIKAIAKNFTVRRQGKLWIASPVITSVCKMSGSDKALISSLAEGLKVLTHTFSIEFSRKNINANFIERNDACFYKKLNTILNWAHDSKPFSLTTQNLAL